MMANTTISRRTMLTVLAGTGAAALVGCDPARSPNSAPAVALPDALLVEVDGGLGVLRGADRLTVPRSVATADGLAIYATAPEGADTAFWRIDTATGATSSRVRLPGRWVPQAVSATGTKVALTSTEVNVTKADRAGGT